MAQYKEDELYQVYQQTGNMKDRTKVLMALQPVLNKKHQQLSGSLPDAALKAEISKHAISGIETYDPSKGAKLSTHVFNHIAQASRLNYTYQNVVRMSEDKQQGKFKHYKKALDDLESELLRAPTDQELATRLNWTVKEVVDLKENLFQDIYESRQEVAGVASQFSDDTIKLNYIKENLKPDELKFFDSKTSGMSQADMTEQFGMDTNKLNYTQRKLKNKVQSLLEKYDG
jgi:DNA-directed RNA polymerase specialized sigma subunit